MTSGILDHLWQSTLVAFGVALLALAFRKAPAGVRYGLWLAASLKFLIPFAALAALGRRLAPQGLFRAPTAPQAVRIEQAVRSFARFPFAHQTAVHIPPARSAPLQAPLLRLHASAPAAPHLDPALILLAVWAVGCAAVLIAWAVRWARVREVLHSASPVGWPAPMPVLASPALMEPGLIGFLRPVLVVPSPLPGRLTRSEIDAILAHEISHLRRWDNLTAAIHMLVEALFWFHPLVWWIGGRLIEERERACDEAVVGAGHDRAAYARGLVESARLYVQPPLSCVAGASGSNLKARVQEIMTAPAALPLSPVSKTLLLAVGAFTLAAPMTAGLLSTPQGRTAVARATAAASDVLSAFATNPAPAGGPDDAPAAKPVVLPRGAALLPPALSVAQGAPAPIALSQEMAAPAFARPLPASTPRVVRPAPAAAMPVVDMAPRVTPTRAYDFVRSYAQASLEPIEGIARWADPLCIRVVGLVPDQGTLIRARVEEVAKAVGVGVLEPGCRMSNVEIAFTTEPRRLLDQASRLGWGDPDAAARDGWLLGRRSAAGLGGAPIQVWYSNVIGDQRGAELGRAVAGACSSRISCPAWDLFRSILVVVDLGRVSGRSPAAVADYVAMTVLSQPRSLDRCNALPSITDLFAGCPGRSPSGVTPADVAYLTALYAADPEANLVSQRSDIAGRMADILTSAKVADRSQAPPG